MSVLRPSLSIFAAAAAVCAVAVTAVARVLEPDFSASVTLTLLPDLTPPAPRPVRAELVAARLKGELTTEMLQNFDLFVYVSKAEHGPLAQRMVIFEKQQGEGLKLVHDWAASTGREQDEINVRGRRVITATPKGYYQLDPQRMYRNYHSASWNQDMPNAMFFNWEREGVRTGLAIHGALGDDIARLGNRSSAGCVHLAPKNAAILYDLIRANYRGTVPRLAYDDNTQTMSNEGALMRNHLGQLKMADGYRVLITIEDYGGADVVASLF
jgi:lipoprotein-anchoring transpeptidase ErfK/SrfK